MSITERARKFHTKNFGITKHSLDYLDKLANRLEKQAEKLEDKDSKQSADPASLEDIIHALKNHPTELTPRLLKRACFAINALREHDIHLAHTVFSAVQQDPKSRYIRALYRGYLGA